MKVEMVETETGKTLWRRDRGGASVVIDGELSAGEALPTAGTGRTPYQFWTASGVPGARVRVPEDMKGVFAHPDGLLIQGDGYIALENRAGAFRWYVRTDGWVARLFERLVVVSMTGASKGLLLVDPQEGIPVGRARGEFRVVGVVPHEAPRPEILLVNDGGSYPPVLRALQMPVRPGEGRP
jgi:hypothetical protein